MYDEITAYLDVATPLPDHADLIFIFGTLLLAPAHLAAAFYQRGIASLIVVTGGQNRTQPDYNEAEQHSAALIAAGVPAEAIIVENRSTNTLENVTFALPLIPRETIRSVLAICKWQHSRRALMTLKRHFPPGTRYYAATYEPEGISRDDWFKSDTARAKVLKNWDSIPMYLQWGHLIELIRDGESWV